MPSPQQLKSATRLATVKQWLIELGWTAQLELDDNDVPITEAVIDRAKATWFSNIASRGVRSRALVAKALRQLRGEAVRFGGKPRKLATFRAPHGANVIVKISPIDMRRYEEFTARVISGNGSELEVERVRPDGMTEIMKIIVNSHKQAITRKALDN